MLNPHYYSMQIHKIFKTYPFATSLTVDDFELLPLYHIDTLLSTLYGSNDMKHPLSTFYTTYLTKDIIDLSMRSILEKNGTTFVENMILSLKKLALRDIGDKT